MSKITIEPASHRQIDRLHQIEKECFHEEAFTKQQLAYLLRSYNSIALIARPNNEIAAFIIGALELERNALTGHVLTLDVTNDHRRKGIGLLLLDNIEKLFKQKGATTSYLEVREENHPALGLYKKAGYTVIGKLRNYYGNANGIYLRKTLR